MTRDGLFPMPYKKLLDQLADLNIVEVEAENAGQPPRFGCRILSREMMGCGTPYVVVRISDDNQVVPAVVVRHILEGFGIDPASFNGFGR